MPNNNCCAHACRIAGHWLMMLFNCTMMVFAHVGKNINCSSMVGNIMQKRPTTPSFHNNTPRAWHTSTRTPGFRSSAPRSIVYCMPPYLACEYEVFGRVHDARSTRRITHNTKNRYKESSSGLTPSTRPSASASSAGWPTHHKAASRVSYRAPPMTSAKCSRGCGTRAPQRRPSKECHLPTSAP